MEMTSGGPKSLDLLWDLDEVMEVLSTVLKQFMLQ